ncbi:hypothetical protein D3C78_1533310 [compost metagenome]
MPPKTPVITPLTAAISRLCPISRLTWQPIRVNATRPTASSTRNSERRWRINGAMNTVTSAATAVSARYSGWRTQVSG